jgi:hypothetical protein
VRLAASQWHTVAAGQLHVLTETSARNVESADGKMTVSAHCCWN